MNREPTWNDFHEARPSELKKTYRLDDRQIENAYRKHLYGASSTEYRGKYEEFYRRNRSDV